MILVDGAKVKIAVKKSNAWKEAGLIYNPCLPGYNPILQNSKTGKVKILPDIIPEKKNRHDSFWSEVEKVCKLRK